MTDKLFNQLCSYSNLKLAFMKARKGKTKRKDVIEFEHDLKDNLLQLQVDLKFLSYFPKPLKTFMIRDPKTRIISKSNFRDRVVHHALCNVIERLFDKSFIYDSYANRKGKGTLRAITRFEYFSRKVSKNYHQNAYVLKADIKHYFDTINHQTLLSILKKQVKDVKVNLLIKRILSNHTPEKGMPLGNLTSQFFANVYLNELDQFVKHKLRAKYYVRYVDDFLIVHQSNKILQKWKVDIDLFIKKSLILELHPDKSKIISLNRGVEFLGFVIFPYYRLLKQKNLRKFKRKLKNIYYLYQQKLINYDALYDFVEGWIAYAKHANTYQLRKSILKLFEEKFISEISNKQVNQGLK